MKGSAGNKKRFATIDLNGTPLQIDKELSVYDIEELVLIDVSMPMEFAVDHS